MRYNAEFVSMKPLLRLAFYLFLSCIGLPFASAQVFSGQVKSQDSKELLPFVDVFVPNSKKGTSTDDDGKFSITLPQNETELHFSFLGYKDKVIPIEMIQDSNAVIYLEPDDILLTEVQIVGKKEKLGNKIIRRVIDEKKRVVEARSEYSCDIYQRTSMDRWQKLNPLDTTIKEEGYIQAAWSEVYARQDHSGKKYKRQVKAEIEDYEDQLRGVARMDVDASFRGSNMFIKYNKLAFFRDPKDAAIDLYDGSVNNPILSDRPITSPIGQGAFVNYRFNLEQIKLKENGDSIFYIKVSPIFKQEPLFTGTLVVDGSNYLLQEADLSLDGNVLPNFSSFNIAIEYNQPDSSNFVWLPVNRQFNYSSKIEGSQYKVETIILQSNHDLNPSYPQKYFDNALVTYDAAALERNQALFDAVRPIKLDLKQQKYVDEQDSIWRYQQSPEYYRIQDSIFNHNNIWNYLFKGVGYKNRAKGITLEWNPAIAIVRPVSVGGLRFNFGGSVVKEFLSANRLSIGYDINFGLANDDIKGRLRLSYTYYPQKFARLYVGGGDAYDLITLNQSIEAILSPRNMIRNRYVQVGHSIEVFNGFYLDASMKYSVKNSIDDLMLPEWSEYLFGTLNDPVAFDQYNGLIFNMDIIYNFDQKYIMRGRKKVVLGSKYPTIKMTYNRGIRGIFNSEVDYDQIELSIYDRPLPTKLGSTNWKVQAGSFLRQASLRFVEQKYIRGSDRFIFSSPLVNLQLLGPTLTTRSPYFQGGIIHHFDGFILDKIPLLNRLQMELLVGAAALSIPEQKFSHAEAYAGIGKRFKLWGEQFQIAVYGMSSINNVDQLDYTWKIGFNLFDAFNARWMY